MDKGNHVLGYINNTTYIKGFGDRSVHECFIKEMKKQGKAFMHIMCKFQQIIMLGSKCDE